MELRQIIEPWRDFYAAAANTSGAPVGLVFAGVSMQLARRPLDGDVRVRATESVVNLLHPLSATFGCSARGRSTALPS
jgi:hypothetical protein